jgi:phosphoribosylpyrophosphate synthetase
MAAAASASTATYTFERTWFIYSSPALETLAAQFVGRHFPIKRNVFPDGSPDVKISGIPEIAAAKHGANVLYFHAYRNLHEKKVEEMLLFVLAETANVKRLVVIDPFDPWATMERVAIEGEVASANIDAHFWKTLPLTEKGHKIVRLIYDQHTLQNRFFYQGGHTQVHYHSAIPIFLHKIQSEFGWAPDAHHAIAFPDEGACKRFGRAFPGYEKAICAKTRDGDRRFVTLIEGDVKGRKVVIIDDMARSGGTLVECAKALLEHGASEVSCYVTHAQFPEEAWRKFLPGACSVALTHFWVSNSCAYVTDILASQLPFHVVTLAADIQAFVNNI